jgi:uncharacterized protein (DUF486 family)
MNARIVAPLLLLGSNIFMTFAWYGHLKYKNVPLRWVILVSWGIALSSTACRFRPTESAAACSARRS